MIHWRKNENEYLTFVSSDKNKEVLIKYTEHWVKTKDSIEKVNDKPGKYGKDFMNTKFNSEDNLPLIKLLKLHMPTVILTSVYEEDGKYYPQVFLDEFLYEL